MNRFFLPAENTLGGQVLFPPETAHQIARVLRLRAGERVIVFDAFGIESRIVLTSVEAHAVVGEVEFQAPNTAEAPVDVWMYLCVSQREKFEWMLQKCTEVGAAGLAPVVSSRSLVQSLPELLKKTERWQRILQEASEQSGRGRIPKLLPPMHFEAALTQPAGDTLRVLTWEEENGQSLHALLKRHAAAHSVAVLVGPEGGFSPAEAGLAVAAGWQSVSLGARILRMETAAVVSAALVIDYYENQAQADLE